ncbi:DNA double-strand break repair nuclease NurA [Ktedonosporobacter rubrisoli]|uniref:DNA double-strand break repair nuclease NurA n=1 Tax=Ktedonosporobacter rubrisoli TaxID=2509675 RepID=A0A4P6JX93_KTERU|nr:DNA double-strand break repair nuclease NurA [Ktedonosporobacter rubrisoli]QBD80023.1 DNA double-strand break repair nuclease NurA [Ktedonosporobacter rubrisoli]
MLHNGKLQAALKLKSGQFSHYDGAFSEQLKAYQYMLETLYQRYNSSTQLEQLLPTKEAGQQSAGARPSIEFDRWLANAVLNDYHIPLIPFGREFANHEQARQWAECLEGITTVAIDGSQLQPWRDASIPVALIQAGFFINPHTHGKAYTKDVRLEVLAPDEIMAEARAENSDPDSYPYSELQVTLRRYVLEVETLLSLMQQLADTRSPDDPAYSPVVFFDGSLVVSFALTMPSPYRERYISSAVSLLRASEELRVPLIGYIDTSYARDFVTMLRRLDATHKQPILRETKKIHDALLWQGRLRWGDRTPAMICARGDILEGYGTYQDSVAFCYLQTAMKRPPARLEFPRWMLDDGIVEPVLDVVRAEVIAGNGYPYAIETADAVAVITMQDRNEFYGQFQNFMQKQGIKFTFSSKSISKGRRR